MIDLVDNIGVLIDETVEIPDIDKEDEFIIQIHDSILNEGITYQLEEAGIILEAGKYGINWDKNVKDVRAKEAAQAAAAAEKKANDSWTEPGSDEFDSYDAQDKALKAGGSKTISTAGGNVRTATNQDRLDQRGEKAEAQGNAREKARDEEFTKAEKAEADLQKHSSDDSLGSVATKDGSVREITKKEAVGLGYTSNKSEDSPGFMSAIGAAIKENPLVALGGAVIAAAGGYLIYRYMNSIYRLNKATNYYSKLASSTSDPAKKAKYQQKASMYDSRLQAAKSKARENKKDFIVKTKEMQSRYGEMKKSGGDAKELAKMEKKLTARNKVLSKIGAI